MDYRQVTTHLRRAYSRESASSRDQTGKEDWKVAERQQFLDLLQREGKKTLLEIGLSVTFGNSAWLMESVFDNDNPALRRNATLASNLIKTEGTYCCTHPVRGKPVLRLRKKARLLAPEKPRSPQLSQKRPLDPLAL